MAKRPGVSWKIRCAISSGVWLNVLAEERGARSYTRGRLHRQRGHERSRRTEPPPDPSVRRGPIGLAHGDETLCGNPHWRVSLNINCAVSQTRISCSSLLTSSAQVSHDGQSQYTATCRSRSTHILAAPSLHRGSKGSGESAKSFQTL